MVIADGARILDERWEHLEWLIGDWAVEHILGTPFQQYWMQPLFMLRDNFLRVQCKLVIAMTDKLLDWAYLWINAEGARVLKDGAGQK